MATGTNSIAATGSSNDPDVSKCNGVDREVLVNLMDRLRAKANPYKSWGEISKGFRLATSDKRCVADSFEKSCIQRILDTLQRSIKVTCLQTMVERLESITRQQGLKFTRRSNTECYISSDMFYVEILLKPSGEVIDVKIADDDPVSSPELTRVLRSSNFPEFTKHLEGLTAIYQLNAENFRQLDYEAQKKQKKKAYLALQSLEIDLSMLAQLQSSINEPSNLVHKSPVGILQQREGGFSLKLTYFISPYDLLDLETNSSTPLTVDAVIEKKLGQSVTVCIEGSTPHKLQTVSLISVSKTPEGKSIPSFAALSNLNSTTLPASFVLKLPEPVSLSTSILRKIQGVTKISDCFDANSTQPLLSVIISSSSKKQLQSDINKDLFVTLPDQQHCYNLKSSADLQGVLISSIPFTHPTHVPQILVFLRQQMLFNTVISSCVRPGSKKTIDSALKFDVHAYSTNHIQITFVHPLDESLAAVDLDLKDITNVKCKIYTLGTDDNLCSDEYASRVMQRCLSIPVTMRAIIRRAQGEHQLVKPSDSHEIYAAAVGDSGNNSVSYLSHISNSYAANLPNGSFSANDFSNLASRMCNKLSDSSNQVEKTSLMSNHSNLYKNCGSDKSKSKICENNIKILSDKNSSLINVEDGLHSKNSNLPRNSNFMLMSMLSDIASGTPGDGSLPFSIQNEKNLYKLHNKRRRRLTTESGYMISATQKPIISEKSDDFMVKASSLQTVYSNSLGMCEKVQEEHISNDSIPRRPASTEGYLHITSEAGNVDENSRSSEGATPRNADLFLFNDDLKHSNGSQGNTCENEIYKNSCERYEGDSVDTVTVKPLLELKQQSPPNMCRSSEKNMKKIKKNKDPKDVGGDKISSGQLSVPGEFSNKLETLDSPPNTSLKTSKLSCGPTLSKSEFKVKQEKSKLASSGNEMESSFRKQQNQAKRDRKRKGCENNVDSLYSNPQNSYQSASSINNCYSEKSSLDQVLVPSLKHHSMTALSSRSSFPSLNKSSTHAKKLLGSNSKKHISKSHSDRKKVKSQSFTTSCVEKTQGKIEGITQLPSTGLLSTAKVHKKRKNITKASGSKQIVTHNSANKKSSSLKFKDAFPLSLISLAKSKGVPTNSPHAVVTPLGQAVCLNQTSVVEKPKSPASNDQDSNHYKNKKKMLQCRKGTILSAVIDKLHSNRVKEPTNSLKKGESSKSSCISEEMEATSGKKDLDDMSKVNENKSKYNTLDQFTVKQSSQGIKLTVTKTRPNDANAPKFRKTSKLVTADGIITSRGKMSSSSNCSSKASVILAASKKITAMANMTSSAKVGYCVTFHPKPVVNSIRKVSSHSSNCSLSKTKKIIRNTSKTKVSSISQSKPLIYRTIKPGKKVVSKGQVKTGGDMKKKNEIFSIQQEPANSAKPAGLHSSQEANSDSSNQRDLLAGSESEKSKDVFDKTEDAKMLNGLEKVSISSNRHLNTFWEANFQDQNIGEMQENSEGSWVSSNAKIQLLSIHPKNLLKADSLKHTHEMTDCSPNTDSSNVLDSFSAVRSENAKNYSFKNETELCNLNNEFASSPDKLIIDCAEHTKSHYSSEKWTNSCLEMDLSILCPEKEYQKSDFFNNKTSYKSPSKSPREVISPPSNNSSSSLSRPSPATYDELMNEAVRTVGK